MVGRIFNVVFTQLANRRLNQIVDDLGQRASGSVALRIRQDIIREAKRLEKLPNSRPKLPDTEALDFEVRYTKSRKYKIIFRVVDHQDVVRVLSIRHDAEDPVSIRDDL